MGDDHEAVLENRRRLAATLGAGRLTVADQQHGDRVAVIGAGLAGRGHDGTDDARAAMPGTDAMVTDLPGVALATIVADCAPVVLFDPVRRAVGVAHCGRRGTVLRTLPKTIEVMRSAFGSRPEDLAVGIGPAIGAESYEIGEAEAVEVAGTFPGIAGLEGASGLLRLTRPGHWTFDMVGALRIQLRDAGVEDRHVHSMNVDTRTSTDDFFSDRAARPCGRFMAVAMLHPQDLGGPLSTWIIRQPGPSPGIRVAVKDLIDMAGLPTTAGSRAVADSATPAGKDAACLAGLRAAERRQEAWFAGKTNLHELAYGVTGINEAFGTPVNPADPRRVPGGSSSGSAVAVASGEAEVAYGTDTGGSIRIPAACCGISGLKTTWGRIPLDGVRPLAPSLDTVGPMARDVAGLAAGMALLEPGFTVAADAPRTVGRLAIDADPVVNDAVDAALRIADFRVEPVAVDRLDDIIAASLTLLEAEAWETNRELVAARAGRIGDAVLGRLRAGSTITPASIGAARATTARWKAALDGLWQQVDLIVVPTLLGFPPRLEEAAEMFRIRGLTSPVNVAGLPALALPVPANGPLPASVQLIGPANSEDRLLAAGAVIERAVTTR